MGIFDLLLWLAVHWWIIAILAALTCCGAVLSGLVSIATIIARLLQAVATVVSFFVTPANQIASKVVYGIALFCLGAWLGHWQAAHADRIARDAANHAAQIAAETADKEITKNAATVDQTDVAADATADKATDEARNEYVASLEKQLKDGCTADSAVLRRLRSVR